MYNDPSTTCCVFVYFQTPQIIVVVMDTCFYNYYNQDILLNIVNMEMKSLVFINSGGVNCRSTGFSRQSRHLLVQTTQTHFKKKKENTYFQSRGILLPGVHHRFIPLHERTYAFVLAQYFIERLCCSLTYLYSLSLTCSAQLQQNNIFSDRKRVSVNGSLICQADSKQADSKTAITYLI